MNRKNTLELLAPFVAELENDFDPEFNLLGNQNKDTYTDAYLNQHFRISGNNWLHSYRGSLAYAWYLLHFDIAHERAEAILETFLKYGQVKDKQQNDYGELFWFMEEKHIRDRNGNFFNGSLLLLIHHFESTKLGRNLKNELQTALERLYSVFDKERATASFTYVNPTLGKFSMCFLLAELFELKSLNSDKQGLLEYIDFLRTKGNNESLSPAYITVDITILFMVTLLSNDQQIATAVNGILKDVFLNEAAFFGKRFPAPFRRGYNGEYAVFRDDIFPALHGLCELKMNQAHKDPYLTLTSAVLFQIAATSDKNVPQFEAEQAIPRQLKGKIYDDCESYSYLSNDFLLGSINYYPPETTCWQCVTTGGSGWQDGPVYLTFNNTAETAAILRLEATDDAGNEKTHPYNGKFHFDKIGRLYPFESFAPEPKIRSLQHEGMLLCLLKVDMVDAHLQKFGFNIHFHRFAGSIFQQDGTEVIKQNEIINGCVLLEQENTFLALFPLSRVNMAESSLSSCSFIEPSFTISRSQDHLDLTMFNCNGQSRQYTQNHISSGFFMLVKEKKQMKSLDNFIHYVNAIQIDETWKSDRMNAHIDKRDSIRNVSVNLPDNILELGWNHYSNTETARKVAIKKLEK